MRGVDGKVAAMTKLVRDPKIRESLKNDISEILFQNYDTFARIPISESERYDCDEISEILISSLEKLGWHGVKE